MNPVYEPYQICPDHFKTVLATLKTNSGEKGHLNSELSHLGTFNINLRTRTIAIPYFHRPVEWGQDSHPRSM